MPASRAHGNAPEAGRCGTSSKAGITWRKIHSTKVQERENRELPQRADVADILPNRVSVLRLLSSLLQDQHAEWVSARIAYVRMGA